MLQMLVVLCFLPLAASQPAIVITIDTSKSMEVEYKLENLLLTLSEWFDEIPDEVLVGMVEFKTDEKILCNLTTSRRHLTNNLPLNTNSGSCIGCGVRAALEVLGNKASLGVIVLITDGENTEPDGDISDVLGEVITSNATVVAVALGDDAPIDELKQLASETKGLFFEAKNVQQDVMAALNKALHLAEYRLNPTTSVSTTAITTTTTTTTSTATIIIDAVLEENMRETTTTIKTHLIYISSDGVTSVLVICTAVLVAVLLVVIVVLLVCRQLSFVFPRSGFYQVVYSRDSKR